MLDLPIEWEGDKIAEGLSDCQRHNHLIEIYDLHLKNVNNRSLIMNISIIPIEDNKSPIKGLILLGTDITAKKQMEAEIARLDRLNMIGEMAASIGHEIRNPMTSVRGFLQMFTEKYREDEEFLNLMIEELDGANAIITEFLSLAKNKVVELVPTSLNSVLKNILPLLKASATMQDKIVKLETEKLPRLLLDEKEIRQIVLNLVNNALEVTQAGGTVTIKTLKGAGNVVLSIRDEGPGISPEILEKMGTPFFTTKDNGTGLGLAVCYSIADRHKAKIKVETGHHGTEFKVVFPQIA